MSRLLRTLMTAGLIVAALRPATRPLQAADVPDRVRIDTLEQYYGKVWFNHAAHIKTLKDCGVCHHHTTGALVTSPNCVRCHGTSGATTVVSCKGCHLARPFESAAIREQERNPLVYHLDKPGLKGAYHLGCLGCHKNMKGPTGCRDCHDLKKEGEALYRVGASAPQHGSGSSRGH